MRRLNVASGLDPASLVVPASVVGSLNDLVERRSGLDERLKTTTTEMEKAATAVAMASHALEETGTEGGDGDSRAFDRLDATTKSIYEDDHHARLAMHMRQRDEIKTRLDAQMAQFHPVGRLRRNPRWVFGCRSRAR